MFIFFGSNCSEEIREGVLHLGGSKKWALAKKPALVKDLQCKPMNYLVTKVVYCRTQEGYHILPTPHSCAWGTDTAHLQQGL